MDPARSSLSPSKRKESERTFQGDKENDLSQEDSVCEIEIVQVHDDNLNQRFVIETSKGHKTTFTISFKEGSDGWHFGRGTVTSAFLEERRVRIADATVSSKHFRVFRKNGSLFVTDLGSLHGTKVNGESVWGNEERGLKIGDKISIGASCVRLIEAEATLGGDLDDDFGFSTERDFTCPICRISLVDLTPDQRGAHINKCVDRSKATVKESKPNSESECCPLCGKNLSKSSKPQRDAHVNRCVDELNPNAPKQVQKVKTSSKEAHVEIKPKAATTEKKRKSSSSVSEATKRFTFTRASTSLPVECDREFNSDDEVFDESPSLLSTKHALAKEGRAILAEDLKQAGSVLQQERVKTEQAKLARHQHFSPNDSFGRDVLSRFPSPFRPPCLLDKATLLRKRKYYEEQLCFIDELLLANQAKDDKKKATSEAKRLWDASNPIVIISDEANVIDLSDMLADEHKWNKLKLTEARTRAETDSRENDIKRSTKIMALSKAQLVDESSSVKNNREVLLERSEFSPASNDIVILEVDDALSNQSAQERPIQGDSSNMLKDGSESTVNGDESISLPKDVEHSEQVDVVQTSGDKQGVDHNSASSLGEKEEVSEGKNDSLSSQNIGQLKTGREGWLSLLEGHDDSEIVTM